MYWNLTDKERLVESFLLANNSKLLNKFLGNILTKKEMVVCVTRLTAMFLLHDGASYTQISRMTGLSSATIARLAKIVDDKESGFREIIRKFKKLSKPYSD